LAHLFCGVTWGCHVEDGPVEPGLGRVAVWEMVTGVPGIGLGSGAHRHVLHGQVLDDHGAVGGGQVGRELVQAVPAQVGRPAVTTGQLGSGLGPAPGALLGSGELPVEPGHPPGALRDGSGVLEQLIGGQDG
jgi:hypothetical protein